MSDRTVYLIHSPWDGALADRAQAVVEERPDTFNKFQVAQELWRLVGNEERAAQIAEIMNRACERVEPVLDTKDIESILRLVEGLEAAVRVGLVDEKLEVPDARLEELRKRSRWLNLSEKRGADARHGVWEGVGGVRPSGKSPESSGAARLL